MKASKQTLQQCLALAGERCDTTKKRPSVLNADSISEAAFQRQVIEYALLNGWEVYHVPDSRRVTACGWVDLVLGHETRGVVFAELKRDGEKPRPSQVWWHRVLRAAGCRVYVWTPSGWGEVASVLSGTTQQG